MSDDDYPDESDAVKLVRKDCGLHFGFRPGPCAACAAEAKLPRIGRQYGGNPLVEVLGEVATGEAGIVAKMVAERVVAMRLRRGLA